MFNWFKKRKDVIDLTESNRVIIKPRPRIEKNEEGFVDLSGSKVSETPTAETSEGENTGENALGFLGSIASAAESSVGSPIPSISAGNLKIRLDSVSSQLSRILDRLELVEKKLERLEKGRV